MPSARVAVVAPFPPPPGGMAIQADILARYLAGEGIAVERVPTNRMMNVPPLRDLATIGRFAAVRRRVDVVNVHTCCYTSYLGSAVPCIWWAKRSGLRVVVKYHGGDARDVFRKLGETGLRWLRMADLVTVPSGFLRDVFREFGIDAQVVRNLHEPGVRAEPPHRPDGKAPKLVMTRGLSHYYNVQCTVRAFAIVHARYPRATLLLAGRGNREMPVRALVKELGLPNVTFLGHLGRKEIYDLYRLADVFVNSSNVDNFPGTILEAALFGVPIATTNAGGIPYMVEHGKSARIVPMDDHEALAREIVWIIEHPDEAERMAAAAQDHVDDYRWDAVRGETLRALGIDD